MSVQAPKTDLWTSMNLRLESIDAIAQEFTVSGWLNFLWIDPDLEKRPEYVKDPKGWGFTLEDGGRKKIQPVNMNSIFENSTACEVDQHQFFYNSKTFVVTEIIHFKATLQELLELENFPFDRQYLTMRLVFVPKILIAFPLLRVTYRTG